MLRFGMEINMNSDSNIGRRVVYVLGLILLTTFIFTMPASASEKPAYTLRKGKTKNILTVIKYNPLTRSKANTTYRKLTWKSSKPKILKVKKTSMKALKKGTATVRGYKNKKRILSVKITVGTPVSKINLKKKSYILTLGSKVSLSASVSPKKASNKKLFYYSSDTSVAKVSKGGVVQTRATGTAKITIRSKDGAKKRIVKITVKPELVRNTIYGAVKGTVHSKSLVWYGIPYGDSTAGENRWHAPKNPVTWTSVKSCTTQKAEAAQYGDGATTYTGTEDCLYVNVYRPNNADSSLPVMVYLHGGGNASGNPNRNLSDLCKATNSVIVAVGYRLGAFGFLSHPALRDGTAEENSGNFTLLDIKKALEWVQANIASFGGNKNNVTLSGFSAGARDVMFCMISPIMKNLFHKAISFSGGMKTCTPEQGEQSVNEKLANILIKRGTYRSQKEALDSIETASNNEIKNLFYSLSTLEVASMYKSPQLILSNFPQGFTDGTVLPSTGFDIIKSGNYNRIPLILGSNESEFSRYAFSANYTANEVNVESLQTGNSFMDLLEQSVLYGSMLQARHYVEESAEKLLSDASHSVIYGYRFRWGETAGISDGFYSKYVGAFHGSDVNFLCEYYPNPYSEYSPNAISSENLSGRKDLSAKMQQYIQNFLYNGNPNRNGLTNWPVLSGSESKLISFDATKTNAVISLTNQYGSADYIFNQMKSKLNKSQYQMLVLSAFTGRFFMPEQVPSYQ